MGRGGEVRKRRERIEEREKNERRKMRRGEKRRKMRKRVREERYKTVGCASSCGSIHYKERII